MRRVRVFGEFLWEFIIGDDWRIALAVVVALAVTAAVGGTRFAAWWILPVAVGGVLVLSLWSAAAPALRSRRR